MGHSSACWTGLRLDGAFPREEPARPGSSARYPQRNMAEPPVVRPGFAERNAALAREWKRLSRAATFVAVLSAPMFFAVLVARNNWSILGALVATIAAVAAFRGLIDVIAHRLTPRASLYHADKEAQLDDATARRRLWVWRGLFRL